MALAWPIARPGPTAPIASATSVKQLHGTLGPATLALSRDDIAALDSVSSPSAED